MADGFIDGWQQLVHHEPGRQIEVGGGHPLSIFYGSDQLGRPIFFAISDVKPGLVTLSEAVAVERGVRSIDGKWTLSLTLRDARFADEFMRLGDELVDSSRSGQNETHALQLMVRAVEDWKRFLSYGPSQQLALPAIRGLLGELWFGFFRLTASFEPPAILDAWTGPFDSPQDFNFTSGHSYEVKTIHPDGKSVRISSAEQLDPGLRTLELAVVSLVDVDRNEPGAVSLPAAVRLAEAALDPTGARTDPFHDQFKALKFDVTDSYYDDFWFRPVACQTYRVDVAFPAIRRAALDAAVDEVRYRIALHAVADFTTSVWTAAADTADPWGRGDF
jgi:hypothetical protein